MRISQLFISVLVVASVACQAQSKPATHHTGKSDAHYYGAVDLGSRGTKASLYRFEMEEEGATPDVVFSKTINTSLVSTMSDGSFTPAGIEDASRAVATVIDAMQAEAAKHDLDVDTFYVVGSSGVARAKNKEDLVTAVKDKTHIQMDFIDAASEGYYGQVSSAPKSRLLTSIYVDIGSGNTKLGCLTGDVSLSSFHSAEIAYGSTSGRNEALKRDPQDLDAGIASVAKDISNQYEAQSRDIPCLRNRPRVYWTGGAAWATATFMHPEAELQGWVVLTRHDVDTFIQRLKDKTWNQRVPVFNFPQDVTDERKNMIREKAKKEQQQVQDVFVGEDLLSGVSVMKAILDSSNPAVTIRFARNGSYIYGYALDKFAQSAQ